MSVPSRAEERGRRADDSGPAAGADARGGAGDDEDFRSGRSGRSGSRAVACVACDAVRLGRGAFCFTRVAVSPTRKLFRFALKANSFAVGARKPSRNPTRLARKAMSPGSAPTWLSAGSERVASKPPSVAREPSRLARKTKCLGEKGQASYRRGISVRT
ncbi:hypothetical protein [Lysobacter enzymogenes]|uniref:hypothetical protein n=1 Tax=Lysobacter enzymogenes TaxID=69 RepID=UPI0011133B46|nr:hypothetical protein [Lysobacter enzymogenes]